MQSLYYKAFNYIENSKPNHLGIYFSLFLHMIILLFAIGLPDFFKPKKIEQKKFTSSENTEIQKIDLNEKPKKKVNTNKKTIENTEIIKKTESKNITLKKRKLTISSKKKR